MFVDTQALCLRPDVSSSLPPLSTSAIDSCLHDNRLFFAFTAQRLLSAFLEPLVSWIASCTCAMITRITHKRLLIYFLTSPALSSCTRCVLFVPSNSCMLLKWTYLSLSLCARITWETVDWLHGIHLLLESVKKTMRPLGSTNVRPREGTERRLHVTDAWFTICLSYWLTSPPCKCIECGEKTIHLHTWERLWEGERESSLSTVAESSLSIDCLNCKDSEMPVTNATADRVTNGLRRRHPTTLTSD